ncbi:sulfotransferase family 2 domain-containing protein [Pseudomonas sp. S3_C01]
MNKPLYYLHIPKTAGTSLTSFLDAQFDCSRICPAQLLPELFKLDGDSISKYDFFRGHLWFGLNSYVGRDLNYITMLRDPVQRTISWYSHVKRDVNAYRHDRVVKENWSLFDFVADKETQWDMVNAQTIFLAADLDFEKLSKDPVGYGQAVIKSYAARNKDRELLDLAKSRLERFMFFGITERMNHSLHLLSHVLDVYPQFSREKLNVSENRPMDDEISSDTIHAIREITSLDQELYDWAVKTFDSRYDELVNSLLINEYVTSPKHADQACITQLSPEERKTLKINTISLPDAIEQGATFEVQVEVTNNSKYRIQSNGRYPINICYHWINPVTDELVIFDGVRTKIEPTLLSEGNLKLNVEVIAPEVSGLLILRMTFVQEGVAWFDEPQSAIFSDSEVLVK